MTASCRPTKRPACRPADGAMRRCRPDRIASRKSSMSTSAWARGPISRPGMSGVRSSSVAVNPRMALRRSIGSSPKSWRRSRTDRPAASSGLSTTARDIAGPKAVERLQRQWPTVIPVFTPIHASWLNQIEIYFSMVQRKLLTPGDFADLAALEAALIGFQHRHQAAAHPFEWTFTRQNLTALLIRLALAEQRPAA